MSVAFTKFNILSNLKPRVTTFYKLYCFSAALALSRVLCFGTNMKLCKAATCEKTTHFHRPRSFEPDFEPEIHLQLDQIL